MTTIAWDGKTLACDSQSSEDHYLASKSAKKLYFNCGKFAAVAIAGETRTHLLWVKWLTDGADPEKFPQSELNDGAVLAVKKNGKALVFMNDSPHPDKAKKFESIGTGRFIASGAMLSGASAIDAIKAARKADLYTGGKIQSYTVKK